MADSQEPTHTLVDFSKEESEELSKEIQAVLEKHDGVFNILRLIDPEGRIQATLQIFKKVPIESKKEEGVVSPLQPKDLDNGRNNKEEGETSADVEAA